MTDRASKPTPLGIVGLLAASVPLAIYKGYAVTALWRWFVVPLGAPPIGIAHAVGLSWLVFLATYAGTKDERSGLEAAALSFVLTTFALVGGLISVGFM